MAGIRDVARRAGVSPATVSRVINGTTPVAADKRERVLRAIDEMGFVPNEVARSLFKKSSKTIGVIIPSIRNPYFTQLADVIDEAAKKRGYHIVLYNVHHELDQERAALQMLAAANADGVIVASNNEALQEELAHYNMPVVVVDALFRTKAVNAYLYCDYYQGGRLAAEHLIACGCRDLVCIRGVQGIYTAQARYEGYRDYCWEHGLPEQVVECDYDFEAGLSMTEALLERFPKVDGIIACNDMVAISVYKMLHKRNIAVPDQIQLVGFDDIHLSSLISPELTTIHQPITAMGRRAVEVILNEGHLPKEGRQQSFPVSLVPRETTKTRVSR
ncbi:LacI family DNA-binding transcriptional regulator [Candidatus Avoscillospira sp. LCP25S3_F1]|uniref:LacI family DNA-binding transcriptional regulator n=1 Tax=Candidatus Avoscillospira sp. LCP25S3_F1 TaxID=3438825 RepID=UPI003F901705